MTTELTDALYEAAFISEKWPSALTQVTEAARSKGGGLVLFADGRPVRGTAMPFLQDLLEEFLSNDTLRLSCMTTRQSASFIDLDSFMKPEEIFYDPLRVQLRARGLGASARAVIPMPSGELAHFVFQRRLEDGGYMPEHIELLDRLRPDMARAGLAAARLGLEQARGTVDALAMIGLPAAVLANSGRVKVTNALFDQETTLFVPTAFGGIALAHSDSNRLFQLALRTPAGAPVLRSFPARNDLPPPVVLHVLPLKRDAHDLFGGGDLLIVATAISASALVPSPTILTGLFDLTPAEVKLAIALAKGLNLKAAAAEAGLQFSTVRTYLTRIFRKTGTNQQSQLVALLKSTHPIQR